MRKYLLIIGISIISIVCFSLTSAKFTPSIKTTIILNAIYKKIDQIAEFNKEKLPIIQEKLLYIKKRTKSPEVTNIIDVILEYMTTKGSNLEGWHTYTHEKLGLEFVYPKNWVVREEITQYNKRIYIESNDIGSIRIDYSQPAEDRLSFEEQVKAIKTYSTEKGTIKTNANDIFVFEIPYNPNSERNGVGPYVEAIWEHNGMIFDYQTADSSNKTNNEHMIDIAKKILSTIKFEI